MALMTQISNDIKTAMKARDKFKTQVLRMLLSECNYAKANQSVTEELSDEETIKILQSYQKRLIKSLDDYPEGEKKTEIEKEVGIVASYLPQKMSEAATKDALKTYLGSTDEKSFGALMKGFLAQHGASVDGKIVSRLLKELS